MINWKVLLNRFGCKIEVRKLLIHHTFGECVPITLINRILFDRTIIFKNNYFYRNKFTCLYYIMIVDLILLNIQQLSSLILIYT